MAVLVIEEYADFERNGAAVPKGPPLAIQQLTIGATVASSAFNAATRFIVVQGTGDCRVQLATTPTAVDDATCIRVPSGQLRSWLISAGTSMKIAAVTAA